MQFYIKLYALYKICKISLNSSYTSCHILIPPFTHSPPAPAYQKLLWADAGLL